MARVTRVTRLSEEDIARELAKLDARPGLIRDAKHRALLERSLRQIGDGSDEAGDVALLAWVREKTDPKALAKARRAAAAADREALDSERWEAQGVDLSDASYDGPAALERAARGRDVWLFHGTTKKLLPSILRLGLGVGHAKVDEDETPGVYLTARESGARAYAERASYRLGGRPVVLRVLVAFDDLECDMDDADIRHGDWQFVTDHVPPEAILEVDGTRRSRRRKGIVSARGDNPRDRSADIRALWNG